jgi:hypothetical protein
MKEPITASVCTVCASMPFGTRPVCGEYFRPPHRVRTTVPSNWDPTLVAIDVIAHASHR